VPPFELNVTVELHLAKNVILLFIVVFVVSWVPPVWAVNQPTKVCPALVFGLGSGEPRLDPAFTVLVAGLTLPPLGLNVTVKLATVHLAKTVILLFITVFVVTCVPPVWAVNQPTKLWPALCGVGSDVNLVPQGTVLVPGETVPPFGLKVTV